MGQLIQLDDRRLSWSVWWATCLDCGWHGLAVQAQGTPKLTECPDCRRMRVARTAPAQEGEGR